MSGVTHTPPTMTVLTAGFYWTSVLIFFIFLQLHALEVNTVPLPAAFVFTFCLQLLHSIHTHTHTAGFYAERDTL